MPHIPQLALSLRTSVQTEPQRTLAPGQNGSVACAAVQTPATQAWLAEHAVLQAPQFAGSEAVTVHTAPQSVCPIAQVHRPPIHVPAQGLLHEPQWARLDAVLTHCPPQSVCPAGHDAVHIPITQA